MNLTEHDRIRLSDRILSALQLSLEQEDLKISEYLTRALEMAMTRETGGGQFVERRDYPSDIANTMDRLHALRDRES